MRAPFSRFSWGFLGWSFTAVVLLVLGLFAWRIAILVGVEHDKSFTDLFLIPLYLLSFGLAGGFYYWFRKGNSRWYESALAYGAVFAILFSLGPAGAILLYSGRSVQWFCGGGSAVLFALLAAVSVRRVRMDIQEAPTVPNPFSVFWLKVKARKRELGWGIIVTVALSVALGVSSQFYFYRMCTQMSMETWASYAGGLQATVWFQQGRYRLLELSSSDKAEFTGRTNGLFEIWTWPQSGSDPMLTVSTADKAFVDAFNRRMRQLVKNRQ